LIILALCVVGIALLSAITTPLLHAGQNPFSSEPAPSWQITPLPPPLPLPPPPLPPPPSLGLGPIVEDASESPNAVDGRGRLDAFDPQTPDIRVDFPPGAVSLPVEVIVYRAELPGDVPSAAVASVGAPFFLGAWIKGEGRTVEEFNQPIVISVPYEEGAIQISGNESLNPRLANWSLPLLSSSASLPLAWVAYPIMAIFSFDEQASGQDGYLLPLNEEQLRLSMYNPATRSWVKLCSRVDPYANKVSAALLLATPLEAGGNALFAVTLDDTPAWEQVVDDRGTTTLSISGSNFRLHVPAGTVEVGTHFEVTRLQGAQTSVLFRILPTPIDLKACQADYTTANKILQIARFPKPLTIEFVYDTDILSRAGSQANLTIIHLQERRWIDLEEFGFRVARSSNMVAVDFGDLGSFSLAVR
jgi:hypothetical protein